MLSHLETAIAMVSCSESVRLHPGLTRCIFLFTIRHSCQIWCVFSFMVCLSLVSDQVYIIVPGLSYYGVWSFIYYCPCSIRLQCLIIYIFPFTACQTTVTDQIYFCVLGLSHSGVLSGIYPLTMFQTQVIVIYIFTPVLHYTL